MLPNPNTFSKLSGRLLAEVCWSPFVPSNLSESERSGVLADILSGKTDVSQNSGAQEFIKAHEGLFNQFEILDKHVRRSPRSELREYLQDIRNLIKKHIQNPTFGSWVILNEHCGRHIPRLFEDIQSGSYSSALVENIHESLQQKLSREANVGMLTFARSKTFVESTTDHKGFIRSLEQEFSLEVHHWEPMADGVVVYLDQEAHDTISQAKTDSTAILKRVTGKHGYLLLRHGDQNDIDFGTFPEATSRWLFVKFDRGEEKPDGKVTANRKHKYGPIKSLRASSD
jgi:hypothetical protein